MATPTSRIAAGLNARESTSRQMSLKDFRNVVGDGELPSAAVLKEMAASSQRRLEKLKALRDQVSDHVEVERKKAQAQADQLRSDLTPAQRKKMVDKAVNRARKVALETTQEDRQRRLEDIRSAAIKVDALREMHSSPSMHLSMQTITTRKPYMDSLRHAGPAELRGAVLNAAATGNQKMMAAALAIADGRGLKVSDIAGCSRDEAALAVSPEYSDIKSSIETLAHCAEDAVVADREAETGRTNANAAIKRGLRDQDRQGDPEPEPEPEAAE